MLIILRYVSFEILRILLYQLKLLYDYFSFIVKNFNRVTRFLSCSWTFSICWLVVFSFNLLNSVMKVYHMYAPQCSCFGLLVSIFIMLQGIFDSYKQYLTLCSVESAYFGSFQLQQRIKF